MLGLVALPLWGLGRIMRQMYAPHYPDMALHAGLALVSQPRRVLAIAAHPGELELHAGGMLFLMARAGSTITAAVLTAGEAAVPARQNLAEIRRREQQQAAAVLGYGRLVQLDLPDQGLTEHPRLAPAVRQVWEEVQPEVVLAPDPRGLFPLGSPDAAAAGYAAARTALSGHAAAAHPAGPPLPEAPALGRAALLVAREQIQAEPRLLLYGTRRPNLLVDITEVLQEKVQAVKCHRSQFRGPAGLTGSAVRGLARVFRLHTPAYYVEGFYRAL